MTGYHHTAGTLTRLALAAACTFAAMAPGLASAAWPERPVTLVVPFPAGGSVDAMARTMGARLSQTWGQPVLVDNRPGAGTMIGSEAVGRADPDGYTLLLNVTSLIQAPHLRKSITFDPVKQLTPINMAATTQLILVVNDKVPATTPAELADLARANPKDYSYGSYGAGSSGHLYMHIFNEQNKLNMVHVAYRGEAPSVTDLLGGQIQAVIMSGQGAVPHMKTGKMRALAVTGPERAPFLPDVPTFKELGYTGMAESGWYGVFGPAGMDPALVKKISDDVNAVIKDKQVIDQLAPAGLIMLGSEPAQFAEIVQRDNQKWGDVIRKSGIQLD
ncbi:tripartite tricarboxylate transporter substrate binding protein [Achromobacter sp. GG226]|uniref:Bug family tripartite tricarboxylate transporter substrate binding protein n=1 Tax=Verticiella alkaliphila TaxID=2779529 RepID=UPI001C0CB98C|nr:tripartite tricarboxylate transporter substrate binding protein [Verticiella sp. GG226]MBU4611001.1 tripartite tricarboxylate transporter substrate binding protein [Verticiella sp. GG226]